MIVQVNTSRPNDCKAREGEMKKTGTGSIMRKKYKKGYQNNPLQRTVSPVIPPDVKCAHDAPNHSVSNPPHRPIHPQPLGVPKSK